MLIGRPPRRCRGIGLACRWRASDRRGKRQPARLARAQRPAAVGPCGWARRPRARKLSSESSVRRHSAAPGRREPGAATSSATAATLCTGAALTEGSDARDVSGDGASAERNASCNKWQELPVGADGPIGRAKRRHQRSRGGTREPRSLEARGGRSGGEWARAKYLRRETSIARPAVAVSRRARRTFVCPCQRRVAAVVGVGPWRSPGSLGPRTASGHRA